MSEDPGTVAVTAGVNALVALVSGLPWSEMGSRIRGVLSRRGRDVQPALAQALDEDRDGDGDGRAHRLVGELRQLQADDLTAVVDELESLRNRTTINVSGGNNAINSGSGDQNVTFG
ncbi:hypothetical protein [Streptomyces sp. CB01580]|uniref:hypothetical protein n=1 Tax=Streptomyces sp. CB01580 TaxID=1703933 RepID=UPI0011615121|nr:hypothetical protein [Streptomyces sp. CB01580]